MAILNVIYNMENSQYIYQVLVKYLEISEMAYFINDADRRTHIHSGLFTAMHGCLMKINTDVVPINFNL